MRAHFPELNVGKKTLQNICARGRGKRKLYQLQRRLKELDANMDDKQDVEDVKAGTNNAEESTKGKQEVVALQAAVKKLTEQCQVQEAARKTEVGEAEHWRKQAQQVAQAKEEAEKELLTKDFQRLMEQHEALKERDKKKIAVLIK
ncbi:hypothetical protein PI124_g14613 [Phytophthora idaei]|nr:hypothetical protein PI125_g7461 [Phytophthora idaei]KAG3146086.1 hypothetical protein PI126_g13488 [Phytophthora idaei]KAG3240508.1 hypothetical protein PI124_g14613 [Phytophthora idaei]